MNQELLISTYINFLLEITVVFVIMKGSRLIKHMLKKSLALFLLGVFILSSGFGCKSGDKQTQEALKPIVLNYWRVFDGPDTFSEVIKKYNALHPNITINYRKLRYEEYENELLNALAEDRGPDIFSIHNTWMKKYESKLAPLPKTTTLAYQVTQGTIKKEVVQKLQTTNSLTTRDLRDNFVDVVSADVILSDGQIYGLPLSVDTLAMYYNKDLFNQAGISDIPAYWNNDFVQAVKKMTMQNAQKEIVQSGVALGGGKNVNRASDILSVLMMQSGATIMNERGQVLFNTPNNNSAYFPGLDALRFYADFSDPAKESYSWNDSLPNSLEMFMNGTLAIMFSYSYDLPTIKAQAPKLNFSIAKLPQIEGTPPTNINFANYWIEVVSKKSAYINEAWDFLQFITKAENVQSYLEKSKKPTALRSLIAEQKKNEEIGVFVDQVLTSKSWYRGKNSLAAEEAMVEMISLANSSPTDKLKDVAGIGAAKIQQTVY